ncbi:ParA family protein [Actinoplanes sp. G11-F43]|uniref:ParA family protein n=1 Tax=Actinoplanes sp. G11-F43 TaxID=3424130 RepID=UPI003D33155B
MALIAVTASKSSPGATVTSLALTLAWPRAAVLAECDPSGGSVLTGYLAGHTPADRGLAQLAVADYHGRLYDAFASQLVYLDDREPQRLLLPGVTDPAQAAGLTSSWDRLGDYLRQLDRSEPPVDVIADCGRIPALNAPLALIRHADVVLVVIGRTLGAVDAAASRLALLRREVESRGGVVRLIVRGRGDYDAREIAKRLETPVLTELPEDSKTAGMLSLGTGTPRPSATLLRAARSAAEPLQTLIDQRRNALAVPASGATARETARA